MESFPHRFGHIFAGATPPHYSYNGRSTRADAFGAFEENGCSTGKTAHRFLDEILTRGGADALEAFVDFRGRRPDVRALLKQHGILATGELAA